MTSLSYGTYSCCGLPLSSLMGHFNQSPGEQLVFSLGLYERRMEPLGDAAHSVD